ncbi:glycosyl hydrolase family 31 [Paraphaeosphaeria sporulosa]
MRVQRLALGLVAFTGFTIAAPAPLDLVVRDNFSTDNCPGYEASNVEKTDSTITADLTLAGDACNVYSPDIKDLRLVVEYQSSKYNYYYPACYKRGHHAVYSGLEKVATVSRFLNQLCMLCDTAHIQRASCVTEDRTNIVTEDRLHVKIFDKDEQVYQVQEELVSRPQHGETPSDDALLEFELVEKPFSFKITRKENDEVLFDTSGRQLIFESQYVGLRTSLPKNPNIYGFGEHSDPFRLPNVDYHRTLYNAESPNLPTNVNLYGSHPVYFDHRGDKGTHGVFMLNANGMKVDLNVTESGDQYLQYNAIGGIIDLYFLAGKQPAEVSKQYADTVGYSAMFPYWTFGFHQCKYGYWDVNMVAEVVGNYSTAGIPLEVMWTDIDYMDGRQDFTTDPERFPIAKMRELVSTLHSRGQRYVLILDPAIHFKEGYTPYEQGHEMGVFYKNEDGSDYLGVQWAGTMAWPDWLHPNTSKWWAEQIATTFSADNGIDLDGIWVDMNEASNFCSDIDCNPLDDQGNPPKVEHDPRPNTGRPIPGFPEDFQPSRRSLTRREDKYKGLPGRDLFVAKYDPVNQRGNLSGYTIWTNNTNADGTKVYDTHNLHGHAMSRVTYDAMLARRPGLRPMVLTRSTFAGSGRKATHWFGDNASIWEHYRLSIRQMLAWVSMHQMPMVGSDVCGFNADANEQMCARWALLGAFQPFYRNHAEIHAIQQEFYQWPLTIKAAKKAIDTRYKLIDYAYTALYYQTTEGTPMINPLFFLYPEDENTFGIQDQWFYGDALLISPVTTDWAENVTFYMPKDTFYDYWTGQRVEGLGTNVTRTGVSWTDIPVHVRGGTMIPQRANSANTTAELRKENFVFIVAPDANGKAKGRLYIDEGEKIEQKQTTELDITWDNGKIKVEGKWGYPGLNGESIKIESFKVLGQEDVQIGDLGENSKFDSASGSVTVQGSWNLDADFEVHI